MTNSALHAKTEYGDFQTPIVLAKKVCRLLIRLGISADVVIEPTCGIGAFVEAAAYSFPLAKKIIGVEINRAYLDVLEKKRRHFPGSERITLKQGDFFDFGWQGLVDEESGRVVVVGNFPWVTNSQQGAIGAKNLPAKLNFQNRSGLDALTGKSNFDISEWMLIQTAEWLKKRGGHLAMLCKTTVARKFLHYLYSRQVGLSRSMLFGIDARQYFGASVDACLLVCDFAADAFNYDYDVYENLDSSIHYRVGQRNGITVRDIDAFERLKDLYGESELKWRSGIKHDSSGVMEFCELKGSYVNGLGETVEIEPTYLFPLLKGSAIANNRINATDRYMLVTQKLVGQNTDSIRSTAPKTWAYLEAHANSLDNRKSRIYRDNPRFAVFGVGPYTFARYKIAICGLYKNLDFRLVGPIVGSPVVFDDTVYFLSFSALEDANRILGILSTPSVRDFYSSMIFWDEKRPIKASILNRLNLLRSETEQPLKLF